MSIYLIWFLLGVFFLFAELACPGFILFFFGVGAIITSLAVGQEWIATLEAQLILFIISSVISLLLGRYCFKRFFPCKSEVNTNDADDDDFIGRQAQVVEMITPEQAGRIQLNGSTWKATADTTIEAGTIVKIIKRTNITFHVQ